MIAAAVGLLAAVVGAGSSDAGTPEAAAQNFYALYGTFHPSDGIPNDKQRAELKAVVSPGLDSLLRDAAAAQTRFANSTKHQAPPLLEGDIFTSNFEGATAWHVGACRTSGAQARCEIALGYRSNATEDAKPVNWADTLYLVHTNAGWGVDDIGYGGNWDFANKGRLTETLRNAIRDGNSASP